MSCLVRFAVPQLINLLKFWCSITRDSLGNARVVYISCNSVRMRKTLINGKKGQKYRFFALFDATHLRILTIYRLEPSSGFSLPFLCISRRLDQNWGSLLQTYPHHYSNYSKMRSPLAHACATYIQDASVYWRASPLTKWNLPVPCNIGWETWCVSKTETGFSRLLNGDLRGVLWMS